MFFFSFLNSIPRLKVALSRLFLTILYTFLTTFSYNATSDSNLQPKDSPHNNIAHIEQFNIPNFWDPRQTSGKLTSPAKMEFLSSENFPPFTFRDVSGRITGFNVDLARAICEELDIACSFRILPFDTLVQALIDKEGDAIIAGLAPTSENSKKIIYSDNYLQLPARFIARSNSTSHPSPKGLAGKRISVVSKTKHAAFLETFFSKSDIIQFDTTRQARKALVYGAVEAHFGDGLSLSLWLNSDISQNCCKFTGGPWLEPGFFDSALNLAFRSEDQERRNAVNYALRQIHRKGIYDELYLRYFPISFF